jgi:predicted DNA-binding transcriptional regulator YafY
MPRKKMNIPPGDREMIIPPIGNKERRNLELLFNLIRYPNGLSFEHIKRLMSEHYNNENLDSDQRKLRRDIDTLESQGVAIKFYSDNYCGEKNIYKIVNSPLNREINFSKDELLTLSVIIAKEMETSYSEDLLIACQKIFQKNLDIFPKFATSSQENEKESNQEKESIEKNLFHTLLQVVKDRKPIKILYFKDFPETASERSIDPLLILKRNSLDFYLIGYDREKREIRRYIIPKILRITILEGDLIKKSETIKEEDLNYHPLAFKIHEPKSITFKCDANLIWKFINFIYPHPYSKNNNKISIKTTNISALYPFYIKDSDCILNTDSEEFISGLKKYINDLQISYNAIK